MVLLFNQLKQHSHFYIVLNNAEVCLFSFRNLQTHIFFSHIFFVSNYFSHCCLDL